MTGRKTALLPRSVDPDKAAIIRNYCVPVMDIAYVEIDPATGKMDLDDLQSKLGPDVAAVYFENPGYLGIIEDRGAEISKLAHDAGAVSIVGVDPISLGVLEAPPRYGADIVCGDLQPLGMHMNYGGGQAGFIATRDEEKFVMEYPSRLFGIVPTEVEGEYGFGDVAYERTSFALREKGKESVGTQTALWGITAKRIFGAARSARHEGGRQHHHPEVALCREEAGGDSGRRPSVRRRLFQGIRRRL